MRLITVAVCMSLLTVFCNGLSSSFEVTGENMKYKTFGTIGKFKAVSKIAASKGLGQGHSMTFSEAIPQQNKGQGANS